MRTNLEAIPFIGSGLGYRPELSEELASSGGTLDFVEIISDQYFGYQRIGRLAAICNYYDIVIPHGVGLSIGTVGEPSLDYLKNAKKVLDAVQAPYYSDHLCLTRVPGIDLGHLTPLYLTDELLDQLVDRVTAVQEYLERPLVLETITYMVHLNSPISEPAFFKELAEATGCGLLLDLTNVYINSVNHSFDPWEFILELPLQSLIHVHLAGGHTSNGVLVDSHAHPVPEEVWRLLADVCEQANVRAVLLEHDHNFPAFAELEQQVKRARRIMENAPSGRTSV